MRIAANSFIRPTGQAPATRETLRLAWLGLLVGWAAGASAATGEVDRPPPAGMVDVTGNRLDISADGDLVRAEGEARSLREGEELRADRITVRGGTRELWASGNVRYQQGTNAWTAERVYMRGGTRELWASGHVHYQQGTNAWTAERVYMDMKTGRLMGADVSDLEIDPFRMQADGFDRQTNLVTATGVSVSTCDRPREDWHYHVTARRVVLIPDDRYIAYHAVLFFGDLPVFYFPYYERRVDGQGIGFRPGFSSRMGPYLLLFYDWKIVEGLWSRTHVDYRQKRGVAVGEDLEWKNHGAISAYYADDRRPMEPDDPPTPVIPSDRYRFKLSWAEPLARDVRLSARLHYLSDPNLLPDFFRDEYLAEPQPDNHVAITYRNDAFTAGIGGRVRLNDFYATVTRMPEAYLDVQPLQLDATRFYYEGRTAAAILDRYVAGGTNAVASATRLDTGHTISLVEKVGFLNVVPRVGYRGTWYSARPSPTNAPGAPAPGPGFRSVWEAGAQLSFRAFKVLREPETPPAPAAGTDEPGPAAAAGPARIVDAGLRHVVEPYVDYTYVPEPNLRPGDLYPFDDVDTIDRQNELRIGVRNVLQVRREQRPVSVADVDVWTTARFYRPDGGPTFETISYNAETRPLRWLAVDSDGVFGLTGTAVQEVNARLRIGISDLLAPASTPSGALPSSSPALQEDENATDAGRKAEEAKSSVDLEYRYRHEDTRWVGGALQYAPNKRWCYRYGVGYDVLDRRLEQQSLSIQRNYDCISGSLSVTHIPRFTRTDGSVHDSDVSVMVWMWIRAFPNVGFSPH